MKEKALLVTIDFESMPRRHALRDAAEEFEELSKAAGLSVAGSIAVRQKTPNAPLLVGRGKAEELRGIARNENAHVVVFEKNLSSTQQRNLEEVLQTKTIDRTQLILDIFAQRARSTEAKLQVELAQLEYLLPRLSGKGIYLSRLGGGVGTRGPGEQKLEVDRRRIRERIARLSKELKTIDRRRLASIGRKKEKDLPLVALVGYTNAGKSALFNCLTKADALVKNQLFSTLDTTTRLLELPLKQKAFLSDTVGFVRDLPHHLVESFKATLEETLEADVLLHVVDASRPDREHLQAAVDRVLSDLGADAGKVWVVHNKADLLDSTKKQDFPVLISAKTGQGVGKLAERLARYFSSAHVTRRIFLPKEKIGLSHFLYEMAHVLERKDAPEGAYFKVRTSQKAEAIFLSRLNSDSLK